MWPRRLRLERHALLFNIFSINNPRGFVNITDGTRAAGRVKPRGYAERLARGGNGAETPRWQRTATNRTETATEERRRYAARHDEREAIALIRESNRNIYEQRTAVWVCRNSSSRATARRSCAGARSPVRRRSRERFV